jgi:type III restriction enzyme
MRQSGRDQEQVPPVLIIVCDNTEIADFFYRKISGESESEVVTQEDVEEVEAGDEAEEEAPRSKKGKPKKQTVYGQGAIFPQYFSNTSDRKYTIRIDSRLLAEVESGQAGKGKKEAAEALRKVVATVGKPGQPGEHVRCVVSVSMLTEGWDAPNVTHILGVRAFGSQLLCEQVVGRGLRRMNYQPDPVTGLLLEEYVDVYGIPFSLIPYKGRPADKPAPEDRPPNRVWALPDREEMEIRYPIVEGYVFEMRKGVLKCDIDGIDTLTIDPRLEPTETFLQPPAGHHDGPAAPGPFEFVRQDRQPYYGRTHFQTILFQITQQIVDDLLSPSQADESPKARVFRLQSRHMLFPQVFGFVQAYASRRVNYNGVDRRELGVERYVCLMVERIRTAIFPDDSAGEPPLLPILNRYRPYGSTGGVDFVTTRKITPTTRSHLNAVVEHSGWEGQAALLLQSAEASDLVRFYARNDHLGLTIKYQYMGADHDYEPDFLIRLVNGVTLLLEIKGWDGRDPERTEAKNTAARRWVTAVNNLGDFGRWGFLICRDLDRLLPSIADLLGAKVAAPAEAEQTPAAGTLFG